MDDTSPAPRSYHKTVTVVLVVMNLLAITYALYMGEPGQRDYYFREGTFYTWFYSAQMLAASLLFIACYFAHNIIPMEKIRRRDSLGWLVFAAGFLLLAMDQVFRVREQLTLALAGTTSQGEVPAGPYAVLKIVAVLVAVALVIYFRAIVLANVRMVLTFIAGFWFLLLMLVFDMLFDSVGISREAVVIMEGSVKLLAMAMFVSAPFVALLDRLQEARAAANRAVAERRRLTALKDMPPVRQRPAEQPAEDAGDEQEAPEGQATESAPPAEEAQDSAREPEAPAEQPEASTKGPGEAPTGPPEAAAEEPQERPGEDPTKPAE